MTKFIRLTLAPLALVALITGCGKGDDTAADSRQVELAPAATGQPQLGDTAQASPAGAVAQHDEALATQVPVGAQHKPIGPGPAAPTGTLYTPLDATDASCFSDSASPLGFPSSASASRPLPRSGLPAVKRRSDF